MFFESPKLDKKGGWGGAGKVNDERLDSYLKLVNNLPKDSMTRLICDDNRFRSPDTMSSAYSEAWFLTFFLAKKYNAKYMNYVRLINGREKIDKYDDGERLADFRKVFGKNPDDFKPEMVRFLQNIQSRQIR
jgi:hypothetical protein